MINIFGFENDRSYTGGEALGDVQWRVGTKRRSRVRGTPVLRMGREQKGSKKPFV